MNRIEDQLAINALRILSMEEITNAKSGHPGIALGAAPIVYTLYSKIMNVDPKNPDWINRDRFVLAAGHGSSLLYSLLHLSGFGLTIDDLKNFRQLNSLTPGHPESHMTKGVDVSSGPLGQGIAIATGLSICENNLNARYPKVVDHYTYVLCGDGDLQEGVTQEAMSLAGHLGVNKLIVLYDSNDIQLDGPISNDISDDVKKKYEAMHWNYIKVVDGESVNDITKAIKKAQKLNGPTIIEVKTIIGITSSLAGSNKVHGNPLSAIEVEEMRKTFGGEKFTIPSDIYGTFKKSVFNRGHKAYNNYLKSLSEEEKEILKKLEKNEINTNIDLSFANGTLMATRNSGGKVLDAYNQINDNIMAGSADLVASVKVKGANGDFTKENRLGRNIYFGVREHAMGAICNGITIHGGMRSVCGAFFVFSDYLKPAIRMSAIMNLPVIYVFSHDSIAVGEDGPTHQPIEQLTMLRSTPNVNVIRPADANEVIKAYEIAFNSKNNPTVICLTRQDLPTFVTLEEAQVSKGAYIVSDEENIDGIIIASGSEVSLALDTKALLKEQGVNVRVVSMPSQYLFEKQNKEYKDKVLPPHVLKRMAVEMGEASHYYKYVGLNGKVYNIDTFGKSGKFTDLLKDFKFTKEDLAKAYLEL